jgi:hypothetical protein
MGIKPLAEDVEVYHIELLPSFRLGRCGIEVESFECELLGGIDADRHYAIRVVEGIDFGHFNLRSVHQVNEGIMIEPNREVNGNFTLFLDDEKLAGIAHLTLYFFRDFS